ncbi:hypothetical protein JXB02_01040, partial [Candidatus Woesearchaeota archaeon]|nr:hypothetical protein [Candidatus Woesearchaeota archaeon]
VWVDGNECTYDWCEAGVGHHDPLTGTPCGPFAECPADTCEGTAFIDWTEGDYGLCSEGECIDYQCTYVAYPDDVRCGWCPDEDGDGVCDDDDLCPGTPAGEPVNDDGCSCSQIVCADGNVCTDDVCDPMTATCSYPYNDADCGLFRQCPEDYCDGASYVDWSASASDRCHEGSCMQYVCTYAVHAYDERCYTPQCAEGETRPCGSNIGICIMGYQACDEHGFWSACEGGVGPGYETCDGLDNDCDLHVDEDGVCGDALGRDLSIPRAQVLTEVVYPGDQLRVLVETENRLGRTLKDLKVTVIVPDLGIRRSSSLFDLRSGKDHTDIVTLDLPYFSAARTVYDVRITVSNDEVARTKYREFILN